MTITTRKAAFTGLAALGVATLLAGCGAAPEDSGSDGAAASDFLPCIVSDAGGFDDKSFNQLSYEGLQAAAEKLGVKPKEVQSQVDTDYAPNVQGLVDQGCNLIITVGFALAEATVESAKANPDIDYALIDDGADTDFDGQKDAENIKPIIYDTAQSAFLAGYAAASYSKSGIVGTFGGQQFPTVTIFMDGFADGVAYFNEQKSKDVKVVGWDVATQTGVFTGGFEANPTAKTFAQNILDQGADVILPVGGPIYQSAIEAIRDSGKEVALIGTDADLYVSDPSAKDLYLTSVLKGLSISTEEAVEQAGAGEFDATAYVGTLENDGVGIAPFHDFESKVDPALADELETIKAGIIDGSITVESPSSPKSE